MNKDIILGELCRWEHEMAALRKQVVDEQNADMLDSVSPELREIGAACTVVGKKIEDSQVEDGDPPFAIPRDEYSRLHHAYVRLGCIIASLKGKPQEVREDELDQLL